MTQYNRKEITALGWSLARATAEKHGGKPRDYLSAAMAEVWRMAKEGWEGDDGEVGDEVMPIPEPIKEDPIPEPIPEDPIPEPIKEDPIPEPIPEEHKGCEVVMRGRFIVLQKAVRPNVYCRRSIGNKWDVSLADKAASEIFLSLKAARDYERGSKKMLC